MMKTQFSSIYELSELPWFDLDDGRLVMTDKSIGPVIDTHSHFAMNYIGKGVDITKAPRPAEHYLPLNNALDLDVYQNKNFTEDDLHNMKHDLVARSFRSTGMRATHTIPNMLQEMNELGVTHSCILPIDFPLVSRNANYQLETIKDNDSFIGLGSVHPMSMRMAAKLDHQKALGARGVKVHPAVQMIRPNHPRCMKLYELAGERDLPIEFHCGPVDIEPAAGRKRSQVRLYKEPVVENPNTTFVFGHSGALQMDEALEIAKDNKNVVMEISCQSVSNVKTIIDEMDDDRIMFGTDWPFYHQSIALAKVLLATENNKNVRSKIFHENAARVFKLNGKK